MLFFTILFGLVLVNILLLFFSVNKLSNTKTKQSVVFKVEENISETGYLPENIESDIVYKKAI